jgi:DNA polymerase-1
MKHPTPTTIDFETAGIRGRPDYPPVPVSVSIKPWGKPAKFYAWGHRTGKNTHTKAQAVAALRQVWGGCLLFMNGKFDVDVAEIHLGLPQPKWYNIHDLMFLLFLDDPHQRELGLKPSAERLLGVPPDERDAVADWLIVNQPVPGVKIGKGKSSPTYWAGFIDWAPPEVVGPYANQDTGLTERLFRLLLPKTEERGMMPAYDRERELMPVLLEMERQGVPVDVPRLRADVKLYNGLVEQCDAWLRKVLKAPGLSVDSDDALSIALIRAGKADPDKFLRTEKTKKISTTKASLEGAVTDATVLKVLEWRTKTLTCLRTFMEPWLAVAERSGGLIYTTWNQVRLPKEGGTAGTRTGRLSSNPNFQNIPKQFLAMFKHNPPRNMKPQDFKKLPTCPFGPTFPEPPMVRSYVIAPKGLVMIDRDYSQQELRILAHFEGGVMLDAYLADPWLDFHDNTKDALEALGKFWERTPIKTTNFGIIYGEGAPSMAERIGVPVADAKALKSDIMKLYPGLKALYSDMKHLSRTDQPMITWGGREVYCEPPIIFGGRKITFDYKMVNGLIQGSAAEATKEALIRFARVKEKGWKILFNVHDQITALVPIKDKLRAMGKLQQCMESVEFDVPLLTEGKTSTTNWAALADFDKKGKRV